MWRDILTFNKFELIAAGLVRPAFIFSQVDAYIGILQISAQVFLCLQTQGIVPLAIHNQLSLKRQQVAVTEH
jgi:hypothetical protein